MPAPREAGRDAADEAVFVGAPQPSMPVTLPVRAARRAARGIMPIPVTVGPLSLSEWTASISWR